MTESARLSADADRSVPMGSIATPDSSCFARLEVAGGPLRIARLQERTRALGPGQRGVVWFQGCSLRCRGCIAESMNAAPPLLRTTPERLADWCRSLHHIDGITLSGGDPLDQPLAPLAEFMELLRQGTTLSVMLYTGRTLEQLRRLGDPLIQRCLASVDILVDGPYVDELNDGAGWRGSSNQVLHALGPRAGVLDNGATIQRRVELVVNASGLVSFTGIPGRGRARALLDRLEQCAANSEQRESP